MKYILYTLWSVAALFVIAVNYEDFAWNVGDWAEEINNKINGEERVFRSGIPLVSDGKSVISSYDELIFANTPEPTSKIITYFSTKEKDNDEDYIVVFSWNNLGASPSNIILSVDATPATYSLGRCWGRSSNIAVADSKGGSLSAPLFKQRVLIVDVKPLLQDNIARILIAYVDDDANANQRLECSDGVKLAVYDFAAKKLLRINTELEDVGVYLRAFGSGKLLITPRYSSTPAPRIVDYITGDVTMLSSSKLEKTSE